MRLYAQVVLPVSIPDTGASQLAGLTIASAVPHTAAVPPNSISRFFAAAPTPASTAQKTATQSVIVADPEIMSMEASQEAAEAAVAAHSTEVVCGVSSSRVRCASFLLGWVGVDLQAPGLDLQALLAGCSGLDHSVPGVTHAVSLAPYHHHV